MAAENPKTDWDRLANPRICGVIAVKATRLGHSMHSAGYAALGLPFRYEMFDTTDTAGAMQRMREQGHRGYSLTIPHKEAVLPLLDHLSPDARAIGAVNTVVNDGSSLHGFNTDWIGIQMAFEEAGVSVSGKRVLLLGAGGASRAVLYYLNREGAGEVSIANRSRSRAEKLALEFKAKALALDRVASCIGDFDVIIQSTPLGSTLAPIGVGNEYPFKLSDLKSGMIVFDLVTRDTPLTEAATKAGCAVVHGTRMLLFQAVKQFKLYTEHDAPVAEMDAALKRALTLV